MIEIIALALASVGMFSAGWALRTHHEGLVPEEREQFRAELPNATEIGVLIGGMPEGERTDALRRGASWLNTIRWDESWSPETRARTVELIHGIFALEGFVWNAHRQMRLVKAYAVPDWFEDGPTAA